MARLYHHYYNVTKIIVNLLLYIFLITSEVCSEYVFWGDAYSNTLEVTLMLPIQYYCCNVSVFYIYIFLFKCDYHRIWLYVDSFGTIVEFVRGGTGVAVQNPLRSVIWTVLFSKDTSSKCCLTEWDESSIRCVNLRCLLICVSTWQKGITKVVSATALMHYIANLYICSFKRYRI